MQEALSNDPEPWRPLEAAVWVHKLLKLLLSNVLCILHLIRIWLQIYLRFDEQDVVNLHSVTQAFNLVPLQCKVKIAKDSLNSLPFPPVFIP